MSRLTKRLLLVALIGIPLLIAICFSLASTALEGRRYREAEGQRVYLSVYFSDSADPDWDAFFPIAEQQTVLDVIEYAYELDSMGGGNLNLEIERQNNEVNVTSMFGFVNGQSGQWVYYVNGTKAEEPPNQFSVSYGDSIEWHFEQP